MKTLIVVTVVGLLPTMFYAQQPPADEGSDLALDFSLDEVREARLVPVVDFKGRRFAAQPEVASPAGTGPNVEVDGGRIQ